MCVPLLVVVVVLDESKDSNKKGEDEDEDESGGGCRSCSPAAISHNLLALDRVVWYGTM